MTSGTELRERARALLARAPPTLETLLTSPAYFGLDTATPLQRAICRIGDGLPLGPLAEHPHVLQALGNVSALPRRRPRRMLLVAAIRGAKSMLAAAGAIRQSQVVDLSGLGPGETPRVSIVSVRKDLADVVLMHLIGAVLSRPALNALLVEQPSAKGDHVLLRHPTGRPIEIKVVAGSAAGSTLVSRWCAGAIFDEAPRMVGASEGVVNLDDMHAALAGRVRGGGSIWDIGSPWAPFGPVYKDVTTHHGHPSEDLVVIRAQGPWLNPVWWTPERCEALARSNPTAYRTDVLAEFADPEESLLPGTTLDRCTRPTGDEPPQPGHEYVAAMDPASRGNAWTLCVATRREGKRVVAMARQWIGSSISPLDPGDVFREMAALLRPYAVDTIETDQWSTDALRVVARLHGLQLVEWPMTAQETVEAYLDFARRAAAGEVVLPADPVVRSDLLRVKKRVTQGGLAIALPQTSDGRHCDYAPAIVRATRRYCAEAARERTPETVAQREAREEAEALKRVKDRFAAGSPKPAWRKKLLW